jgi:HAD superfamily phosphatase
VKALLFDMDGVLVDVTASFRQAIRMTVRKFSGADISNEEVQAYKNRGGLNNDWDLTAAVLRERGLTVDYKDVVEVFQGFYLGADHDGLIRNEKWLLDRPVLESLAGEYAVGIVTGRPAAETEYTLGLVGVRSLFPVVVTMNDIPLDKGKPAPLGIQRALARLGLSDGYYAGDTADDMLAAKGAGLVPIGVVNGTSNSEARKAGLLKAGAVRIVTDINKIKEALS